MITYFHCLPECICFEFIFGKITESYEETTLNAYISIVSECNTLEFIFTI